MITEQQQRWLEGLVEFLRIPSISTYPDYAPDVRRAAEFCRDALSEAGLDAAQLIEGSGNPLVYGEWRHAAGKPTILIYGHYDVQPADPIGEWQTPPFEPTIRNGNIYARGAADDKGQVYLQIQAVASLLAQHGSLPVNVCFLIEGEEETGGRHIEEFVSTKSPLLQADAALICDTELFAPRLPTLCLGLRGIIYCELAVRGAKQDLHSGSYGGVAPNPIQAIAEILTSLKDRNGHLQIPGIYDDVEPPSEAEVAAWNRLPFDAETYREEEVGSAKLTGEPGYSIFERLWSRPTLEVHGIVGGFTGEGAKTVIPAQATAKISMRLVPNQDPHTAVRLLASAIAQACPEGVEADLKLLHGAPPSLIPADNRYIAAAAKALTEIFGQETVYVRSGGSIPIAGLFQKHLNIPSILMGFGLPDDNLHAPNEKFHLPNFFAGITTVRRFLQLCGE